MSVREREISKMQNTHNVQVMNEEDFFCFSIYMCSMHVIHCSEKKKNLKEKTNSRRMRLPPGHSNEQMSRWNFRQLSLVHVRRNRPFVRLERQRKSIEDQG